VVNHSSHKEATIHRSSNHTWSSNAQGWEASVHADGAAGQPANQGRTPIKERILDTCGQAQDGDARNIINARRMGNMETRAAIGYHPRRGGPYDNREDRSPTLEPPGTRVFSREIRTASFPRLFRQPTLIDKYTGETDPRVWINDYHWHASWAEPPPTRSSSATCRCTSRTRPRRGSIRGQTHRQMAKLLTLVDGELYKRTASGILQWCVPIPQGRELLRDIHAACVATTRRRAPSWATHSARASTGLPQLPMPMRLCAPVKGANSTPARPTSRLTPSRRSVSHGLLPCGG
jgi:hypothetical protein